MLRALVPTALALLLTVTLSACGGTGSAASHRAAAALAFSKCMRANGVPNFPDPGSGGGGGVQIQASHRAGSGENLTINGVPVKAPAFRQAMTRCQSRLPHVSLSPAQIAKVRAGALAMARCMRAHGVPNFPDPEFHNGPGGGIGIQLGGSGLDPSSPAFQTAARACRTAGKGPIGPPPAAGIGAQTKAGS